MRQLALLRECCFSYSEAIIIFQQVSFKYKPWIINSQPTFNESQKYFLGPEKCLESKDP